MQFPPPLRSFIPPGQHDNNKENEEDYLAERRQGRFRRHRARFLLRLVKREIMRILCFTAGANWGYHQCRGKEERTSGWRQPTPRPVVLELVRITWQPTHPKICPHLLEEQAIKAVGRSSVFKFGCSGFDKAVALEPTFKEQRALLWNQLPRNTG